MSQEATAPDERQALSLVDTHQHFQDLTNHVYPWLSDTSRPPQLEGDLDPIRRDYLPEDYARDVAGFDIRKTVHVQNGWSPDDPVGETIWLQGLAERTGLPNAIVAAADLSAAGVERILDAHCAASPAVRGIRQILNWHDDPPLRVASRADLMDDVAWRRGFALLRRYELSFDLQVYWPQMDMALDLARAFPDTVLVLDHFGMPIDRSAEGVGHWSAAMMRLAQAPNVMVKLSGFGLGHPGWTLADTGPLLKLAIAAFGADRTMIGTNLPVDLLFAEGAKILGAATATVSGLSKAERQAVLTTTAERVYRI